MSGFDTAFNNFMPLVGAYGGVLYDIYRPNYSQPNNTPALVAAGVKFRTDPTTGKFAEPRYEGVMQYDIFGPSWMVQSGDLLVRSTAVLASGVYASSPDIMYPVITVTTFYPNKAFSGVRTGRMARIQDSKASPSNIIYNPVYFDWLGQGYPGSGLNKAMEDSLKVPNQRCVLYYRQQITRDRSHLVEQDLGVQITLQNGTVVPYERTWLIDEIDYTGPIMVLTLRNL